MGHTENTTAPPVHNNTLHIYRPTNLLLLLYTFVKIVKQLSKKKQNINKINLFVQGHKVQTNKMRKNKRTSNRATKTTKLQQQFQI